MAKGILICGVLNDQIQEGREVDWSNHLAAAIAMPIAIDILVSLAEFKCPCGKSKEVVSANPVVILAVDKRLAS